MIKLNFKLFVVALVSTIQICFSNDFKNDINSFGVKIPDKHSVVVEDIEILKEKFLKGEYEQAGNGFLSLLLTGDYSVTPYLANIFAKGLGGVNRDCKKATFFIYMGISKQVCDNYDVLIDWVTKGICKDELPMSDTGGVSSIIETLEKNKNICLNK